MCGIGGSVSHERDLDPLLNLILEDQRKRGPDHSAMVHFKSEKVEIALAHNRLAILDLTDNANQPFIDQETGACIVFNGEIYNYLELRRDLEAHGERFHTKSDTEILMRALLRWGKSAFARLNGMFAFALWNPQTNSLMLARDRFGVKPCYYIEQKDKFAFASNTSALAKFFQCSLNLDYLSRGILYSLYDDMQGSSPYNEIHSLPPGHILEFKSGRIRIEPYYNLDERVQRESEELQGLTEDEIFKRLDERIHQAVAFRLRADVPVALSLSGGLDSGLLASYVQEHKPGVTKAFTFGSLDNIESEAPVAKATADSLGLNVEFVDVPVENLISSFERTLQGQGAPFVHLSAIAQNAIAERMNARGYRVGIGGQGADEVFMGYRKFQFFYFKHLTARRHFMKAARAGLGVIQMMMSELNCAPQLMLYSSRYFRRAKESHPFLAEPLDTFSIGFSDSGNLLGRQIADVRHASLLTLLRYEDLNSMAHSVESRMPFLDYNVMETGLALPAHMKIRHGYGKWALRRLSLGRLPEKLIFMRSKRAFALDPHHWLDTGLGAHLESLVKPHLDKLKAVMTPASMEILRNSKNYLNPRHFPLAVTAGWMGPKL